MFVVPRPRMLVERVQFALWEQYVVLIDGNRRGGSRWGSPDMVVVHRHEWMDDSGSGARGPASGDAAVHLRG